jgi:hypothetical protein
VEPGADENDEARPVPLTEDDFAAALDDLRAASTSRTPQHDVLAACERLLAAARTTEDFQRLIAVLNEAPQPRLLEPLMVAAFMRWAERDPAAAATGVDALRYMHMRQQVTESLFRKWAADDPGAALAFLDSAPPGSARLNGPAAAFRAMARVSPEAAMIRALEWKYETLPQGVLRAVCDEWVQKDMEAALDFARREPDAGRREKIMSSLMRFVPPERGWREALTLADPGSGEGKKLLLDALDRWGHHHVADPVAAVLSLPPGSMRDELLERAAEHAAINGLSRGEALLATLPDNDTRTQWLALLARGAMRDPGNPRPAQAIRLAAQLPPGGTQTRLMAEAGERWGQLDPPAASHWLVEQPAGPLRDAFAGEFVRGTFATDPAAALTWAATINDGAMREQRLTELFGRWQQRDAPAARAWLQEAKVSDAERAVLLHLESR